MNRYSTRLILAGIVLGLLAAGAAALGTQARQSRPAASAEEPVLLLPASTAEEALWAVPAVEAGVFGLPGAAPGHAAGADGGFLVALQAETGRNLSSLFLCDRSGTPLSPLRPDADGTVTLGPIPPGDYCLRTAGAEVGRFSLLANASLSEAEGCLWTDGELLHLTDKPTGEALLQLRLPCPGYYSLSLVDRFGRRWQKDLFIPQTAAPDDGGFYLRTLVFRGLPAERYTAVYAKQPLAQFSVSPDLPAEAALVLERAG